ncbi:hypothetical protein V5O48_008918 [Marasmius crinis-equi]|uniref:F-box domain-containing protein n=1 Tax=Marasmius crinis-equi TaxID=585013 RepID=A0ABR3FCT2_9AGAR
MQSATVATPATPGTAAGLYSNAASPMIPTFESGVPLSDILNRFPVEMWEHVFSHMHAGELVPSRRVCKAFYEITVRPFNRVIHWRSWHAFKQWNRNPLEGRLLYVPREVTVGPRHAPYYDSRDIEYSNILPIVSDFHKLTSFTLSHVAFPLIDILHMIRGLPRLQHLQLNHVSRGPEDPFYNRPAPIMTCTSLRTIQLRHVVGTPLVGDEGLERLVKVLSLEGLNQIRMTLNTFIDLLESINQTRNTPTASQPLPKLASTVRVFEVEVDRQVESLDTDFLDFIEYTNILVNWLQGCSQGLEHLSLRLCGDMPTPLDLVQFPNVIEYTGPHSLARGFKFGRAIQRVWVPACPGPEHGEAWVMSRTIPARYSAPLTHLSIWNFDTTDTSIHQLFTAYPQLKEVSLVPSTPLTTFHYSLLSISLESVPALTGLSIIQPDGALLPPDDCLSYEDQLSLLGMYKRVCPLLEYVRFKPDLKHVWDSLLQRWAPVGYDGPQLFLPADEAVSVPWYNRSSIF